MNKSLKLVVVCLVFQKKCMKLLVEIRDATATVSHTEQSLPRRAFNVEKAKTIDDFLDIEEKLKDDQYRKNVVCT